MAAVYVFGNGLSLGYSSTHYNLDRLTRRVRKRLKGIQTPHGELLDELDEIVDRLQIDLPPDAPSPANNFEAFAGPLERLAATLDQFETLQMIADETQLEAIASLAARTRGLYTRVVGAVLLEVTAHIDDSGDWDAINRVAEHLVARAKADGEVDVFVLNYDALLDSGLVGLYETGTFRLMDEFHGGTGHDFKLAGDKVYCFSLRDAPYHPDRPRVRLHHLHGAATWFRSGDQVRKAQHLDDLRKNGLFERWMNGSEKKVEPVVVLGDRKERLVARAPFDEEYAALRAAVASAEQIVVAGYAFRDLPLNATLRGALGSETLVTVVNPDKALGEVAREELALTKKDTKRFKFIKERLPDGLDDV